MPEAFRQLQDKLLRKPGGDREMVEILSLVLHHDEQVVLCAVILTRAAEEGAKRALADVGLDGDEAALDIRDLRSLVDCIRLVRRTAMQTAVRMITTGVMLALLAGIAIKLKIFGGSP